MSAKHGLFIGGRASSATSNEQFVSINPATQQVIAEVDQASQADIDRAVESAQKGFAVWSKTPGHQRRDILLKAASLLRERNDELALIEVEDTGKPIAEANCVDILSGADAISYFAGVAPTIRGDHFDLGDSFAYTRREPLGIVAGIGAWNYPIQIACWKAAPALACGNAMIFKPSELTPLTALKLAEIFAEAGVPEGVFNVVQGDGRVGEMLTAHPDIAKVSLTGEVDTGRKVMQAAAKTLKHITMELGGKSPLIIFEDCHLNNAVSAALMANFYTQGEICSNGTRVFVHKKIKHQFLSQLLERVSKMRVGDPMDPKTDVGALISQEHFEKVKNYLKWGKKEGAELLIGGEFPSALHSTRFEKGNFITPAVFAQCHDDMRIVQEEIFGPVMSVLEFEEEGAVIERANHSQFGLAAGVFTKDIQRAHRVVSALQAGTCWINNYNLTPIEMPFGGYKNSGIGRENSLVTIEHYTQLKSVYVEMGDVDCPYQ